MRTETISILNGQLNPKTSNGGSTKQLFTVDPASLGFDHLLKQQTADVQSKAGGSMGYRETTTLDREASRPRQSGNDLPRETPSTRDGGASRGDDRADVRKRQDSNVEARGSQQNDSSSRSVKSDHSDKPAERHEGRDHNDCGDGSCSDKPVASTGQVKPTQGKDNTQVSEADNDAVSDHAEVLTSVIADGEQGHEILSDEEAVQVKEGVVDPELESQLLAKNAVNLAHGDKESEQNQNVGDELVASDQVLSTAAQSSLKQGGQDNPADNEVTTEGRNILNAAELAIDDAVTDGEQGDGQVAISGESSPQPDKDDSADKQVDQSQMQAQAQTVAPLSPELDGQAQVAAAEATEPNLQARRATLQAGAVNPSNSSETVKASGQGTQDQSQSESDKQGFEQKFELPISGKLQTKSNPSDVVAVNTPVQERLAALARSLDQSGGEKPDTSNGGKATSLDALKSLGSQRGGESATATTQGTTASRSLGTVQTPLPSTFQGAMQAREWASELGQKLMMMVGSKIQSAQIQLNPRDMGPIDVKVVMQQEQAHVMFSSQVANTREALEQALPRLREMFDQNGVGLADVDVRDQSAEHSQQEGSELAQDGQSWESEDSADDEAAQSEVTLSQGLVDYYA